MEQYTDEQLDMQLGTTQKQFTKFRTISLDNGIDMMGTFATGKFIEKKYDATIQKTERIEYADMFPGIILASKAQVADKAKYPSWRSGEFDPMNVEELIDVFPLKDGKYMKNDMGDTIKTRMTYRQLKDAKSTRQPDGSSISTYNYFIILYIGVDDEVIKLKFKGASRSNWFDYSKLIASYGAKLYNVATIFSTYVDPSSGKYAIKFEIEKDDQNIPDKVDENHVRNLRIQVANSMKPFVGKSLPASTQSQQLPYAHTVADTSPIRDNEVVGGINPADVPFA